VFRRRVDHSTQSVGIAVAERVTPGYGNGTFWEARNRRTAAVSVRVFTLVA
jgi:hypothetical protein